MIYFNYSQEGKCDLDTLRSVPHSPFTTPLNST